MESVTATVAGIRERAGAASAVEEDADTVLVARVREGDTAAFNQLVRRHRERLFNVLYNLTGNREDAADLAQDTFVRAFRNIAHFQSKSSFFTWLYRIGVNLGLSQLKRRRLRQFFSFEQMHEEVGDALLLERLVSRTGLEKGALLQELQEKLNEALQKLSPNHRTVVVLFEIENLSHAEIAQIMGCSEGTVRSRLHYAKQQLQASLSEYLQ